MEKVLVLLATYNGEKYLQEQLNSIYNQENVDITILARDDGSTDSTLYILEDNSRYHSIIWYQGKHKNVQKSFYELMKKGRDYNYQYYAFADQDDVWDANKLETAINQIKEYEVPTLYYAGQRLVDAKLNYIEDHRLNTRRTERTRFVLSDFAGCTGVFNRSLLDAVCRFEPKYMLMHDTWILRVCLAIGGSIIVDPEPRMCYRQHSGNTLGLGHSLGATLKQVKLYLNEYHIEKLTRELVKGYGNEMVPEYKELCELILNYKSDKKSKNRLLDKSQINFYNPGLNAIYWFKVKMNML